MTEGKKPFKAKIEDIVRAPVTSKRMTKEIIDEIYSSENHNLFFLKIRESNPHKKLFFLHRFDIFGANSEVQLPYFYLTNIPKVRRDEEKVPESRTFQHVVSREINVARDSKDFLFSFLGIPKANKKELEEDFRDILAYFTILFIRSNEELVDLINAKEFNYKIMKSILKDYKNISFDGVGKQLSEVFEDEEGKIDPVIRSKIEKIVSQIVSGVARNIPRFAESSRKVMPDMMLSFHRLSRIWLSTILTKTFVELKDYINILDDLFMNELIENKSTVFWCENCSLESPSYSEYHGRIAPSIIIKNKCLKCGRTLSYSAIFSLNEVLKDAIFSKDGFLAVYFGWLLEKENIPFTVSEYSLEYENDFIINNDTLVECKMFKSEKDKLAINSELENSLVQIKDHIYSLNESSKRIEHAYLIWNRYENPTELISRFVAKYRELFKKYNFRVSGPEEIEDLISKLKGRESR
jgi:hypothetical protein